MKRSIFAVVVLALAALALTLIPRGTALAQDQRPVIAQPEQDGSVRGVVQIVGTATHTQFQRYELYYAPWPVPADNAWIFIGPDAHFQQQPLGLLGTWDSRAVADGAYALRVRVVKRDANYIDSEPRRVVVANTKQAETPTPTVTPTTTASPTPTGPAATVPPPTAVTIATVPAASKATAGPTATRGAAGTPAAAAASGGSGPILPEASSILDSAGSVFDLARLSDTAQWAAMMTLGAFALVGVFFGVKGLLYWLWLKIRP